MMRIFAVLFSLFCSLTLALGVPCPTTNPPKEYLHLSTQTPYFPVDCSANYHAPPSPSCSLSQYHLVSRHGVRIPGQDDVDSFDTLVNFFHSPQVISIISQSNYANFLNLTNPFHGYYVANQLTLGGQQSMFEMSQRFLDENYNFFAPTQKDLPLSSKFFNPESYDLRSTWKSRTGQSLSAFMYGLTQKFGTMDKNQFFPIMARAPYDGNTPDLMLRFFDACSKWTKEIDDNPQVLAMEARWNDKIFPQIVKNVNERFGLSKYPSLALDTETVQILYTYCANYYSLVYDPQYCYIFTDEERDLIEYADDMEMYYEYGYGFNLSTQMAAPYLQNIWSSISSEAESGVPASQWGSIRIGHAETMSPILALMGLFQDDFVLTENISAQQFAERKWRNEVMSGYGANIQIMLYSCPTETESTDTNKSECKQQKKNAPSDEYYVRVLHSEKEVIIPGCEGIYCEYNTLKNVWAEALSIDYDAVCENN